MLSIDEAIDVVLERTLPPTGDTFVTRPLLDAVGHVLAEDVNSDIDLPPFSRSTMDGFAVRSADAAAGVRLLVVGESAAGSAWDGELGVGQALRIFTGAPMPRGADAVVMVERTRTDGDAVVLEDGAPSGQNIARQGEDLASGAAALSAGTSISTAHVGLLASIGATELSVFPRPRVAILATGAELVPPEESPGFGMIRESNGSSLAALVRQAGAEPVPLGRVTDDPETIRQSAERGLACDFMLISGGSSVGDYDFTPKVLADLGVEVHFDRVSLKPGKPTLFGTKGDRVVFGLPGNPISTFVVFHLFVRPALLRRAGERPLPPPRLAAVLEGAVPRNRHRDQVLPASASATADGLRVRFTGWHGSGDLTCLNESNALLFVPMGEAALADGDKVQFTPIDGGRVDDVAFGVR